MLAELAIANAAYKTIKASISAGKELHAVGMELSTYFGAKADLAKKVETSNKPKSKLDEFMALETLRFQEQELKQLMIYGGRAGLWDDWLLFQATAARERKQEARDIAKLKQRRMPLYRQTLKQVLKLVLYSLLLWPPSSVLLFIFMRDN